MHQTMSMYFDSCVRDQTLLVLFTIAFGSSTLLTAILILCLNRQFRRVVHWLFFQRRTVVCEYVGQLNSSQDSRMSRPSKQIKYMQDLFELNDETVKHIDLKDLVEENQRRDPGLPPFDFEEFSKDEKELEKNGGKLVERTDAKMKLFDKVKPVGPNPGLTKQMDVEAKPTDIETRRTHETRLASKHRAEPNIAEGEKLDKMLFKLPTNKVVNLGSPKVEIRSKFAEAKFKLRPIAKQPAVNLKIKRR